MLDEDSVQVFDGDGIETAEHVHARLRAQRVAYGTGGPSIGQLRRSALNGNHARRRHWADACKRIERLHFPLVEREIVDDSGKRPYHTLRDKKTDYYASFRYLVTFTGIIDGGPPATWMNFPLMHELVVTEDGRTGKTWYTDVAITRVHREDSGSWSISFLCGSKFRRD